jgi:hypothetical protein
MSTLAVNAVTDANGGNTATINSMTPTADSLQGFRNRIINGDMRIAQRGTSSVTQNASDYQYPVDRFGVYGTVTSKFTAQQSSTAPAGFINSIIITSSSAYSVLTGDSFVLQQFIEGTNVADLGWGSANAKTVTLSFWVRSSLTGTFGGAFSNSAVNRSYPFTYTISVADTWEQKSVTIPGDTTGTWLTTNGLGIRLWFNMGAGSTFSGTAGAWAGADYRSATGATSVVGTNGATWYITGVQLEVGSVATPFERRPYGTELALCQRYFQKLNGSLATYSGTGEANANFYRHLVEMRSSPTVTVTTSPTYTNASALTNDENSVTGSRFYVTVTSTGRAFATGFVYTCSSEL